MAQWSNKDASSNSVLWAPTYVNLAPNTTNRDNLFGNTTADAFTTGETIGMFGVDTTEVGVVNGSVIAVTITSPGSGYSANGTVTVTNETGSGFTANAQANATGYISNVNISAAGSSYETVPTITISAPSGKTFNASSATQEDVTFNANSGVANSTDFITTSSAHNFTNGTMLQYIVATGNTAIGGLVNATIYFAVSANSTALKLSTSEGGAAINVTAVTPSETGHTLRRRNFIEISSNVFQNNDIVTYTVSTGNTAIVGLTNATPYFVVYANAAGVSLSSTRDGTRITLTPGTSESGHTLTGQTATAVPVISSANKGIPHSGWNLRTVGSGGRAGRVSYETLVAMGSMLNADADAEDTVMKDV
ncbi:hypothetical protein EB118_10125 [bacterium]|nr:hypothetical protein [bacterium]